MVFIPRAAKILLAVCNCVASPLWALSGPIRPINPQTLPLAHIDENRHLRRPHSKPTTPRGGHRTYERQNTPRHMKAKSIVIDLETY
jgi:hypothetical protein